MQEKDVDESEKQFILFQEKYTKDKRISKDTVRKINDYLNFYYGKKHKIAKCYTKTQFSAGACSTQRAESLNAKVKKFIKIARRSTYLKLIDCFKYINNMENYHQENTNRIMKMKQLQTEDPILASLAKNHSPYMVEKMNEQLCRYIIYQ